MVLGTSLGARLAPVDLAVTAQVGYDGEVSPAALNLACKSCKDYQSCSGKNKRKLEGALTLLASMAVHVRLQ